MKPSKYRAKPTIIDGIRFASQKEARRYTELKLLEKTHEIECLVIQPVYPYPITNPIFKYKADFRYITKAGNHIIEDVKGVKTPIYRLKKKLIEREYALKITET